MGAPKSAAGYDLTALFVGSEGTLGLITELTLKLHGQPEAVMTAVAAFPSVKAAVDCVIATMQMGLTPARIEFLDEDTVAACNAFSRLTLPPAPQLLVEFHGHPQGLRGAPGILAASSANVNPSGQNATWVYVAGDDGLLYAYTPVYAKRLGGIASGFVGGTIVRRTDPGEGQVKVDIFDAADFLRQHCGFRFHGVVRRSHSPPRVS